MLCTELTSQTPVPAFRSDRFVQLPVKVARVSAGHALLALRLRLRWLIRLVRLITSMRRRLLLLLLLLLEMRSAAFCAARMLRGVHAARTLKRHVLHLGRQVLSLLWRRLLRVGVVTAHGSGDDGRVSVVDWRFVAAAGKLLRIA